MKVISKAVIMDALKNGGKVTENTVYQERRVYDAEGNCIGAARWDTLVKLHKAGEIVKHFGGWSMTDTYTAARTYAEEQAAESARVEAATREALAAAGMLAEEEAPAEAAPATVCVECYETGERLEGPARAVYGAMRWAARRARFYGERGEAWRPVATAADPAGDQAWRLICDAEELNGPAAAPEGIRAEYIGAAVHYRDTPFEYWRFRGHVFREDAWGRISAAGRAFNRAAR